MKRSIQVFVLHALLACMPALLYAERQCEHEFECFEECVSIPITMTIPQLVGPIPEGGNLDITPFAISPSGALYTALSTNIIPASALIQGLNPIEIHHPTEGNWVIGYFVTLGATSPIFSVNTIANFSGIVLNAPVGSDTQTITIPVQTLFLNSTSSTSDHLTISANFPIVTFR